MDKFEDAICEHNPLYKEGLQDKYYQGAKWAWQSRQSEFDAMTEALLNQTQLLAKQKAEINQLQSQINEMAEVGLSQESVIRGKDKRIESALSELESLHNKKWAEWKEQADMHSQGEANAYEHAMQILEKVLRGEHE